MPKPKFDKGMLAGTKEIAPHWAKCSVLDFQEKEAKSGDSMNWIGEFKIKEGEYAGMTFRVYFNEQIPERVGDYLKAFGDASNQVGQDVIDVMRSTIGKDVGAFVSWDTKMKWNSAQEFRKAA